MIFRSWVQLIGFSVFFAFLAISADAQQKRFIRAGEQQNNTRLVFPFASDQNWEMRTSSRRVTLSISGTNIDFDSEKVFDRIARGRILEVKSERIDEDVFIRLSLGCDCIATAKVEGVDLIIDVSPKPKDVEEPSAPKEIAEGNPTSANQEPDSTNSSERRPTLRPKETADNQKLSESPEPNTPNKVPEDVFGVSERLKKQLEKAASQGLIELAPKPDSVIAKEVEPIDDSTPSPDQTSEKLDATEENVDGLEELAKRANRSFAEALNANEELSDSIRITVPEGFEQPSTPKPSGKPKKPEIEEEEQLVCFEDEYLDIRNWSDGRDFSDQFSELQNRAFGEFDEPVISAVHDLIRLYLYHGLGTEAKSLIHDLTEDDPQSQLFIELARIVEGKTFIPDGSLDNLAGCEGLNSLWRTAAIDLAENQPVPKPQMLIDVFAEFPIEIRRLIGPRIVQSFISRNQIEEAVQVFAIVERAPGNHGDEHHLVGAKLGILTGNTDEAEQNLWQLINQGSHLAADAAILLSNSFIEQKKEVPKQLIELLDTLAFEHRETPLGLNLRLAEIFARSGSNRILDAVKIIKREMDLRPEFEEDYYEALDKILAGSTVERTGYAALMQTFFDHQALVLTDRISPLTKQHLANEFLKSGLPGATLEILASLVEKTNPEILLASAVAHLQMGEAERAIELVNELSSREARSAMVQAFSMLGKHRESYETAASENVPGVPVYAWNAGAWEDAVSADDDNIKTLAQYMLQELEDRERIKSKKPKFDPSKPETAILAKLSEDDEISLEYAKKLSQQSQLVRQFFQDALSDF